MSLNKQFNDMDFPAIAGRVGQSLLAAFVLAVIVAALYPYIPQSGPFGIRNLYAQVVKFAIPAIVVGVGAVAWWLLYHGGF